MPPLPREFLVAVTLSISLLSPCCACSSELSLPSFACGRCPYRAYMRRPSLQLLPLDTQSMDMAKLTDYLYIGSEDIPSQTSLLR